MFMIRSHLADVCFILIPFLYINPQTQTQTQNNVSQIYLLSMTYSRTTWLTQYNLQEPFLSPQSIKMYCIRNSLINCWNAAFAYSTFNFLISSSTCCYPCTQNTWRRWRVQGRLFHMWCQKKKVLASSEHDIYMLILTSPTEWRLVHRIILLISHG